VKTAKFFGILFALSVTVNGAVAQVGSPPTPPQQNMASETAALRAEIKADVATARAQEKSVAATRQQIQAIKAALRAKLAAMHH
jgi:hypothetical protein